MSPGMPYPSVDRAVNLSALRRAATKERNLSGIIIFIRICDSSRAGDIYFEAVSSVTPTPRLRHRRLSLFFHFFFFSSLCGFSLTTWSRGKREGRGGRETDVGLLNVGSFDDLTLGGGGGNN